MPKYKCYYRVIGLKRGSVSHSNIRLGGHIIWAGISRFVPRTEVYIMYAEYTVTHVGVADF